MKLLQFVKHRLTIALLACSALIVTVLIGTPFLIDMGIERWMISRGHGEVQVENVDFNPFTGRVSMDNLVVETESGRILHIPHASIRFSWKQLFAKHVHFKEMMVRDTFLVVDRFEEVGFRVGGFILQELVGATDKDDAPAWGVGIDRFELVNSRIAYQTPEITATYYIDQYTLTGLESWDEKNTVAFELQGRIDESPIHIKTKFIPFDTVRSWDGTLSLQNGSLALFAKALAPQLPMAGSIDIDTKVQASLQRDGTLHIATDGNVGIEQLAMEYDGKDISQGKLAWQGKLSARKLPNQGIVVNADGKLIGKGLEVAMPAQGLQVALAGFNLQGETELERQNDSSLAVTLTVELTGAKTSITDTDRNLTLLEANSFTMQRNPAGLKASWHKDGTLHLTTEGNFGIEQLTMEYEQNHISEEELIWQGKLSGSIMPPKEMALKVDGRLVGKALGVAMPEQGLQVALAGFNLQGKTDLTQQDDTLDIALTAELTAEKASLTDRDRNLTLLEADSFAVNGIHIADRNDISIANIAIQQPLVVAGRPKDKGEEKKPTSLMHATAIEIRDTTLNDLQNLIISDLHLQDSQFFVARHKDGSWYLIDELLNKPADGEQKPVPDRQEVSGAPLQLLLQNFRITGNSSVRFEDESPFPPYRTTFLINEFLVTEIDTAHKDKPAGVKLDGMIGRYGTAMLNGDVYVFEKPLSLEMTGEIKALDLPPLSSYTGQMIGYILTSGQMDAELKLVVDKGELLGEHDLLLRNLEVKPQDPAKMEELGKKMDVPLESGLAMLRNKKDEVRLKIKLQGNIDNPEFDIQDAINQALAKSLQFGAVNYLKYALQPFGTYLAIAQVAGKAGKEIIKVRLDPVAFAAGEKELDETAALYLKKVAGILNDRPQLRVEICGKAVEADRTALRDRQIELLKKQEELKREETKKEDTGKEQNFEVTIPDAQLQTLAEERAHLVKETLFSQYGVDHARMYLCLPEIVTTPGSLPLVELLID